MHERARAPFITRPGTPLDRRPTTTARAKQKKTPSPPPPTTHDPPLQQQNVDAVVGYYRDALVEVDGNRGMDAVFSDICAALDAARAAQGGGDAMDRFCNENPSDMECRVYDD